MLDDELWRPVGVIALTLAGGLVAGWLSRTLVGLVARRRGRRTLTTLSRFCHTPWTAMLMTIGVLLFLPLARIPDPEVDDFVRHLTAILAIAAVAWFIVRLLFAVEEVAYLRLQTDFPDNLRQRRARTQITVLRRVTVAAIAFLAITAILMSFPSLRSLGTSLLASAGLIGIAAGLAAQSTLSNLIAGVQVAFSDAVHIDDVVVVEEEWGRIEEITLTYVVVRTWDERRLVLPTTHLTTKAFQNWTRRGAGVLGAVPLHVDPATDIGPLRERARQVVEASPLWDGRTFVLQVTDSTESTAVVRVLASAASSGHAWDLQCEIREALLDFIRNEHREALPRGRQQVSLDGPPLPVDQDHEAGRSTR